MLHGSDHRMKIKQNGIELEVVNCMHWNPATGVPECLAGHDVSQCETCTFKQVRPVFSRPPSAAHFEAEAKVLRGMRGLGDVVAAVTTAVGIQPCGGCEKRKEFLNKIVPFGTHEEGQNNATPQ